MSMRLVHVHSLEGFKEPEIGRWLWALEDVRRDTKSILHGVTQEDLDEVLDGSNSIGALLAHIALIEADWVYVDLCGLEGMPEGMDPPFPESARDEHGWLVQTPGVTLGEHLGQLDRIRASILDVFQPMTLEDWNRPRSCPDYDVTPAWVIYHLIEHEAHHRGQIADWLRIRHGRQKPDGTRQKQQR